MAMSSNIKLDTQEQQMEDAKAKAKARYDQKLLDDQEEQISNLLLMTGMQDPRNARAEMKPRKEYSHFEDELPSSEVLIQALNDPEAIKALAQQYRDTQNNKIVNDKKIDAIKDDFVPPMAKAPSSFGTFKDNTDASIPEGLLDDPESLKKYKDLKENYPEGNWWMKQLTPKVDEALKALADKDPELLQLPEVQKLVKEREFWRNKGMDLFSFAPLATDPNATTQAAMGLIDKGDKNLMDAANNLETLRARQLEATKAVADNLTSQKQIAGGLHNAVLGLEGNLAQVSIPSIQQANDLRLQAEQIHDAGDQAIGSAIANMQTFVQRLSDMGASKADVAKLTAAAAQLNPGNIREFIKTVNGIKINKGMRREFNERLNAISDKAAQYEAAMINARKLNEQADFHDAKANGLMTAASNLGGEYKIPEWMNAPAMVQAQTAPAASTLSTPFSDEKSDVPAKEVQSGIQKPNGITPPPPPPPPKTVVTDPWYSAGSIQKLSTGELDNLFNALYNADIGKSVKGAKVDIYQTEQGSEGNAVGARKELAVAEVAQNTDRFINTLDALANSNPKGLSKKLNALKNVEALNYFKNKVREGTALRQLLDNATNSDIRGKKTSFNFGDQESQIASLLAELGYV